MGCRVAGRRGRQSPIGSGIREAETRRLGRARTSVAETSRRPASVLPREVSWLSRLAVDSPQLGRRAEEFGCSGASLVAMAMRWPWDRRRLRSRRRWMHWTGEGKQIVFTTPGAAATRVGCWEGELLWGMGMGEGTLEPTDFVELSGWTESSGCQGGEALG